MTTMHAIAIRTFGLCLFAPISLTSQIYPHLTAHRDFVISGTTADLSRIGWIAARRDGGVVIGQPKDSRLLFFNSTGRLEGTFGREGGGPGEFHGMSASGWLGDTLWIADQSLRRVTLIAPDRTLVRTLRWPAPTIGGVASPQSWVSPLAMYADGSWLLRGMFSAGADRSSNTTLDGYVHVDKNGVGAVVVLNPIDPCIVSIMDG